MEAGSAKRWIDALSWLLPACAVAAAWLRLPFGLDFLDESYFVALPYSFVLGHRPFLDELAVHQLSGLLLLPAVKLYVEGVGSNDGIVLFVRHLHLLCSLVCAGLVFRHLRTTVGGPAARMIAAIVILFVPTSIASMSYNTMAEFGLLAGLVLLVGAGRSQRASRDLFWGTWMLAWATFAYPTLIGASGPTLVLGLLLHRRANPGPGLGPSLLAVGAAGGVVLLAAIQVAAYAGSESIAAMLELHAAFGQQGGGLGKLWGWRAHAAIQWRSLLAVAAAFSLVYYTLRRGRGRAASVAVAAGLGPALALAVRLSPLPGDGTPLVFWVLAVGVLPLLAAERRHFDRRIRLELGVVASVSLLAGAIVGWSSAMGFPRAAIGFVPAVLVFFALLRGAGEAGAGRSARGRALPFAVLMASFLAFLAWERWTNVYADRPVAELTESVEAGPYRGIRTSRAHSELITQLTRDIQALRGEAGSILFFDNFPAGYLLSDLRPATGALWMFPWGAMSYGNRATREIYAAAIAGGEPPDLIVQMKSVPLASKLKIRARRADPVRRLFPRPLFPAIRQRTHYDIRRAAGGGGSDEEPAGSARVLH